MSNSNMKSNQSIFKTIISDYELSIIRIILYGISELPFRLGIEKTVSVLRGNKSTFNIDHELNELDSFSVLATFSKEELTTIVEILIQVGLIEIENISESFDMPILNLSPLGKKYLYGNAKIDVIILDHIIDKSVPELDDDEKLLFENLRSLRLRIAKDVDLPPFVICHDKTIRELCLQKPLDEEELLTVKGIGKNFVEKYGSQFLEEINNLYE
jgi:ATP-dependent DNA helicase RecQ